MSGGSCKTLGAQLGRTSAILAVAVTLCSARLGRAATEWEPPAQQALQQRISALVADLTHEDRDVRARAASSLQALGSDAAVAIPSIAHLIRHDPDDMVRVAAMRAMGAIRASTHEATVPLIEVIGQADQELRSQAMVTLGSLVPLQPSVVPELLSPARHPDASVRLFGISRLGEIGPGALDAASTVAEVATADSDPLVRLAAAKTLLAISSGHVGPAVSVMSAASADPDEQVRREAMHTLGSATAAAPEALPVLLSGLGDEQARVRDAAAESLGSLGVKSRAVLAALTKALDDGHPRVRLYAAQSLGHVGDSDTTGSANALRERLADSAWDVRLAAAGALIRLGVAGASERKMLRRTIADAPDEVTSRRARMLLQAMETRSRE